jgi:hypothetical protein
MGDLSVRSVNDGRGDKQRFRLLLLKLGKKTIEPWKELLKVQEPTLALRLDQSG